MFFSSQSTREKDAPSEEKNPSPRKSYDLKFSHEHARQSSPCRDREEREDEEDAISEQSHHPSARGRYEIEIQDQCRQEKIDPYSEISHQIAHARSIGEEQIRGNRPREEAQECEESPMHPIELHKILTNLVNRHCKYFSQNANYNPTLRLSS